jgi:isocitrate dehydrogenase kinase/phosphatase
MSGEPWFHVNDGDIFPEEFLPFLGFPGDLRDVFLSHHAELLRPGFWLAMQAEHRAGRLPDLYPYPQSKRYEASL